MNVQIGDAPWSPTNSLPRETFRFYDAPLSGVIEQDGSLYLFHALVDTTEGAGLWVYAPISGQELDAICVASVDAQDDLIFTVIHNRGGILAAVHQDQVRHTVRVSSADEDPIGSAIGRLLEDQSGSGDESSQELAALALL